MLIHRPLAYLFLLATPCMMLPPTVQICSDQRLSAVCIDHFDWKHV